MDHEADIFNPLTPRLRPYDPDFGFSRDLFLRPIEIQACRLLQQPDPPSRLDVLRLFEMMTRGAGDDRVGSGLQG